MLCQALLSGFTTTQPSSLPPLQPAIPHHRSIETGLTLPPLSMIPKSNSDDFLLIGADQKPKAAEPEEIDEKTQARIDAVAPTFAKLKNGERLTDKEIQALIECTTGASETLKANAKKALTQAVEQDIVPAKKFLECVQRRILAQDEPLSSLVGLDSVWLVFGDRGLDACVAIARGVLAGETPHLASIAKSTGEWLEYTVVRLKEANQEEQLEKFKRLVKPLSDEVFILLQKPGLDRKTICALTIALHSSGGDVFASLDKFFQSKDPGDHFRGAVVVSTLYERYPHTSYLYPYKVSDEFSEKFNSSPQAKALAKLLKPESDAQLKLIGAEILVSVQQVKEVSDVLVAGMKEEGNELLRSTIVGGLPLSNATQEEMAQLEAMLDDPSLRVKVKAFEQFCRHYPRVDDAGKRHIYDLLQRAVKNENDPKNIAQFENILIGELCLVDNKNELLRELHRKKFSESDSTWIKRFVAWTIGFLAAAGAATLFARRVGILGRPQRSESSESEKD